MTIPFSTKDSVNGWLTDSGLGSIADLTAVSGGCIAENFCLTTTKGEQLFLKTVNGSPPAIFQAEADGLDAMRLATNMQIPKVFAVDNDWLLLEYIHPGQPAPDFWLRLAEGLAQMHRHIAPQFGFPQNNFCGTTPQINPWCADGYSFFGQQRLRYQGELARQQGLLGEGDVNRLEQIIERLPDWIPEQPASLIHGDLWSGNIHCNQQGQPVLVDPACHYGWREADIAMTQLFGALPQPFYEHYHRCFPMSEGWQQRLPLYNLYHLLNHLNLFGTAYLTSVQAIIARCG